MNDYLRTYKVKIHALSPIYIGSGEKMIKKEYIYLSRTHKVIIPNSQKMIGALQRKGLMREYQDYILDTDNHAPALSQWLQKKGFTFRDYAEWKQYEMDVGEARPKDIECFIKDAYGMPYVPGSSIKGMFRTALIAWEIQKNPEKFKKIKQDIRKKSRKGKNGNQYLAKETEDLEQLIFYTLKRDSKDRKNAVNDTLSGIIVSDSLPIRVEQLTLSQKIDYSLRHKERSFPVLRESLIPGTEIEFSVTIDSKLCNYTMEDVVEALNCFQQICYKYFYSRFRRGTKEKNIVWLGGGVGFLSKNVIYPLFGEEAVKIIDNIYKNTLKKLYGRHKHEIDVGLGIAPRVCKCTRYQGELYDMGMGRIEYIKI